MLKLKKSILFALLAITLTNCIDTKKSAVKKDASVIPQNEANDSLTLDLALRLEDAIYAEDHEAYFSYFALDKFSRLVFDFEKGHGEEKSFQEAFKNGMGKGIKNLSLQVSSIITIGGSYNYISHFYDQNDQTYHILFRMFQEDQGLNYHEYIVSKIDQKMVFQDIYIYLSGERLSKTMSRFYLASLPQNILEKLINGDDAPNIQNMVSAFEHNKKGQYSMALDNLEKITGRLRHEKMYHLMKIQAASQLEDYIYRRALNEMAEDLDNDPTASLLFVDHYIFQKEYDRARDALKKLEEKTHDTFINYLMGNLAYEEQKYLESISFFEIVEKDFPDYLGATFNIVGAYCHLGEYKKCISIYENLLENEGFSPQELIQFTEEEDIYGQNELRKLAESTTYITWKNQF